MLLWEYKQLILMRTAVVDTITPLQDSGGDVILVSEVHDVLTNIYDIMGRAVSKQIANAACILTLLYILLPGIVMKSGLLNTW